jgi:hypothetical protein
VTAVDASTAVVDWYHSGAARHLLFLIVTRILMRVVLSLVRDR